MIKLTAEHKELFSYIDQLVPDNGHLVYDFRDAKQYKFAQMMIVMTGKNEKYPGILKSLELTKALHEKNGLQKPLLETTEGWQNMFTIPGLNPTANGTIASNGLATVVGGYSSMNLTLMVQSRKSKNIVAHGFSNNFTQTLLTVNTQPSTSTEIDVDAYMQYHGTPKGAAMAASPYSGLVTRKHNNAVTADPTVTAPVRRTTRPNNPKAINIGLGRAWTDQGGSSPFDYAWNEPVPAAGKHPKGKIPLEGYVTFSSAISSPLAFNQNFLLNIYVADQTGGGGAQLSPSNYTTVAAAFSIDPGNPAKLKWSLPPGQSTSDPGNPIVFGNVPWGSDTSAYFYCEIDVVLSNGSLATTYIQSSPSVDPDPLDGTKYIMPIDFIWHCLAEDSLVTMADGSEKIIKDIVARDKVQINNQGDIAIVEWTNLGIHKGPVLIVETDTGEKITASDNHIFFTESATKLAAEIISGDKLKMLQGVATVKSVKQVVYEGLLCNLATVKYQDPDNANAEIGMFYANNFLVGDINAQRVLKQKHCNDINWVKSQVPEHMHLDIDSFFAEKKSKRARIQNFSAPLGGTQVTPNLPIYTVHVKNGQLVDASDKIFNSYMPQSTSKDSNCVIPSLGWAAYYTTFYVVLASDPGHMRLVRSCGKSPLKLNSTAQYRKISDKNFINHAQIAGQTGGKVNEVIAAGEIDVIDGKIVYIDTCSGHFQPNVGSLLAYTNTLDGSSKPLALTSTLKDIIATGSINDQQIGSNLTEMINNGSDAPRRNVRSGTSGCYSYTTVFEYSTDANTTTLSNGLMAYKQGPVYVFQNDINTITNKNIKAIELTPNTGIYSYAAYVITEWHFYNNSLNFTFTDETDDIYSLSVHVYSYNHEVDYNSDKPNINKITFDYVVTSETADL